jgi:hypothetical protein
MMQSLKLRPFITAALFKGQTKNYKALITNVNLKGRINWPGSLGRLPILGMGNEPPCHQTRTFHNRSFRELSASAKKEGFPMLAERDRSLSKYW